MIKKVLFIYKKPYNLSEYGTESLWAKKLGDYYKIDSIPFFVYNIALGDLVSVEDDEGELYFEEIIESSGNSTVQLIIINNESAISIGNEFEILGCRWEENRDFSMISIDIDSKISYLPVKQLLELGEQAGRWSYRESCLEHNY